jgi:hypothetical protein
MKTKYRKLLLAATVLAALSQAAHADLAEVGHDIKTTTKSAAHKTGRAAREAGHATANAAREVGHGIANTTRHGYHAVKRKFHKTDDREHS